MFLSVFHGQVGVVEVERGPPVPVYSAERGRVWRFIDVELPTARDRQMDATVTAARRYACAARGSGQRRLMAQQVELRLVESLE